MFLLGQAGGQPEIDLGSAAAGGGIVAAMGAFLFLYIALILLLIIAQWKVFSKAGQPGWAALIPVYNIIVLLEIVGRPTWWVAGFLLCPPAAAIMGIILAIDLAKSFGKSNGFAAGLILLGPIFLLILGFGSAQYQGPPAASAEAG